MSFPGFVYVFQAGEEGPIKIGYSVDPIVRFSNLRDACPWPLKFLGMVAGSKACEAYAHAKLRPYLSHGEWFRHEEAVVSFCRQMLATGFKWPSALYAERPFGRPLNTVAKKARAIVRSAALPIEPGDTIRDQLDRAARRLGYPTGDWRIKAAWYGEAGSWSASAFEELQGRSDAALAAMGVHSGSLDKAGGQE